MENFYRGVIIYKEGKRTQKSTIQGSPTLWDVQLELIKAGAFNNKKVQRICIFYIPSNKLVCEWVM